MAAIGEKSVLNCISELYPEGYEQCTTVFQKLILLGASLDKGMTEVRRDMEPNKWVKPPDQKTAQVIVKKITEQCAEIVRECRGMNKYLEEFDAECKVAASGANFKLSHMEEEITTLENYLEKYGFRSRHKHQFADEDISQILPLPKINFPYMGHGAYGDRGVYDFLEMSDFSSQLAQKRRVSDRSTNRPMFESSPAELSGNQSSKNTGLSQDSRNSSRGFLSTSTPAGRSLNWAAKDDLALPQRVHLQLAVNTPPSRRRRSKSTSGIPKLGATPVLPKVVLEAEKKWGLQSSNSESLARNTLAKIQTEASSPAMADTPEEPAEIAATALKMGLVAESSRKRDVGPIENAESKENDSKSNAISSKGPSKQRGIGAILNLPPTPPSPQIDEKILKLFNFKQ